MSGTFGAGKIPVKGVGLGPLEAKLMDTLWKAGPGKVRHLMTQLDGPRLAYTTVMTTLNRLFAKGLIEREKSGRAFIYKPRYSREEWDNASITQFLATYIGRSPRRVELLISFLIGATEAEDPSLLDELDRKINAKRIELKEREKG